MTAKSTQQDAAQALAGYLAYQPVHAGWTSVRQTTQVDTPDALCHEALEQALLPRIDSRTAALEQFLDQQINQLARSSQQKTDDLYARIQVEYQKGAASQPANGQLPEATWLQPRPKASTKTEVRGP